MEFHLRSELLQQANLALELAQTRYKLGLSSIVELSQAELQQTEAQIGSSQANYDYQLSLMRLKVREFSYRLEHTNWCDLSWDI